MGLSSSKQTTTNEPSAYSKGYITPAANALQDAYGQTAGLASGISQNIAGQLPGLSDKAFGTDPGIAAATGYNTDVLNGKYLDSNPYLDSIVKTAGDGITDRVNSIFSKSGRTGSGANSYALGKSLSESEDALRYGAYNDERGRQGQAAALAPSLNSSQYTGLAAYLQAAQSAVGLPQSVASNYAGGVGSLLGNYNTQTQTSSQGLGSILASLGGSALSGWASGGFK